MLRAIDEKSADWSGDTDGITLNGTTGYHMPGRNGNYVYADYFYKHGYRIMHFMRHRYLMLYRIENTTAYVDAIYHQLSQIFRKTA